MVIDVTSSSRRDIVKWIRLCLSRYRIKLRKKLSQVMLVEPSAYRKILDAVVNHIKNVQRPVVVEVGAGLGTLSSILGKIAEAYVIAIEIDKRFTPILKTVQEHYPNVDIVIGDARTLLKSTRSVRMVVGNLPYHITSDLITVIGGMDTPYSVITIQKDVADRLTAPPGSKNYGKISLYAQYIFDIEVVEVLPPNFFIPSPEVFSAIILLKRKKSYTEYAVVEPLVKCLFSYRRKYVLKSLKRCLDIDTNTIGLNLSDELWRKRVYQLAPQDIDKLVTILRILSLKQ